MQPLVMASRRKGRSPSKKVREKRPVIKCGARATKPSGRVGPCSIHVTREGDRCSKHKGRPPYDPQVDRKQPKRRPRKAGATRNPASKAKSATKSESPTVGRVRTGRRPSGETGQNRERQLADAADYCIAVLQDGYAQATIEKASEYLSEETMKRLEREWHGKSCRGLARIAKIIISFKSKLHGIVGDWAARTYALFRSGKLEGMIVREIAAKIPLPWDHKLVVAARGTQVIGISMCFLNGDDLTKCQCFIDLVLDEGKEFLGKLIQAGMKDWIGLSEFRGAELRSADAKAAS